MERRVFSKNTGLMNETNLVSHRQVPGHQTTIVFIHGFGGLPEKAWGKFPDLFLVQRGIARFEGWQIRCQTESQASTVNTVTGQ